MTLVGEAAHVTVPGGEGANTAMLDGAELAQAIAANPDDVEAALASYETAMFARSEAEAIAAHETVDLIFGDAAPYALARPFDGATRLRLLCTSGSSEKRDFHVVVLASMPTSGIAGRSTTGSLLPQTVIGLQAERHVARPARSAETEFVRVAGRSGKGGTVDLGWG